MSAIGANLKTLREVMGVTQTALARSARVSQSGIAQIENGQRNPSFTTLLTLKRALGVTWVALLRGIE